MCRLCRGVTCWRPWVDLQQRRMSGGDAKGSQRRHTDARVAIALSCARVRPDVAGVPGQVVPRQRRSWAPRCGARCERPCVLSCRRCRPRLCSLCLPPGVHVTPHSLVCVCGPECCPAVVCRAPDSGHRARSPTLPVATCPVCPVPPLPFALALCPLPFAVLPSACVASLFVIAVCVRGRCGVSLPQVL